MAQELFSCEQCPKSFTIRGRFNQHLKTHSKPWKCELCSRGFGLRADLSRHTRLRHHVGNLKHKCSVGDCRFSATRKDNLRQHIKTNHSNCTTHATGLQLAAFQQAERIEKLLPSDEAASQHTPKWLLLMQSASNGNIGSIVRLLDSGYDIDSKADDGSTALHCAARAGQTAVLQLLIDKGAQISVENWWGRSPLMEAALGGHSDCILSLLQNGATTRNYERGWFEKPYDLSFVDYVVRIGNVTLMKDILQEKTPHPKYEHGSKVRALAVAAARNGQTAILKFLLDSDTEVLETPNKFLPVQNSQWGEGKKLRLLWYAVFYGHTATVKLLLTPTTTYKSPNSATLTPGFLTTAARKGYAEIFRLLLDSVARSSPALEKHLDGALLSASRYGHLSVIKTLRACEAAFLTLPNIDLGRAMLAAFWENHLEIVQYLLQHDPQTSQFDEEAKRALSLTEIVKCLLEKGTLKINKMYQTRSWWQDKILLYLAAEHGDLQLAKFVLQHEEFDVTLIENSFLWKEWGGPRETALDAAQRLGHTEVADLLIAHGAINHHISIDPKHAITTGGQENSKSPSPDAEGNLEMHKARDFDFDYDSDI